MKTLPLPAFAILAILLGWRSPAACSTIDLPQYGFQIEALDSPVSSASASVSALVMLLPATDNFAPNINVQIQQYPGDIKAYAELSKGQFTQMGWKVISERFQGNNEWIAEYTGSMQNNHLHFYARAASKDGKVYLVTATAAESQWGKVGESLKEHVNSFRTK